MSEFYGRQHRILQDMFLTHELAKRVQQNIVVNEFGDEHKAFIEERDMFFLTTIDHRGYPTCSYKGGHPGFVKVLDKTTLIFPSYDGNGMFLSMGNLSANNKIGMLFINFETPHRVRVHGEAEIVRENALLESFPAAELVVRVKLTEVFVNCPRYIHPYKRAGFSKYVPQQGTPPRLPAWKRISGLTDVLPERDREVAEVLGTITPEEYAELVRRGEA
jgi:predicted pyridoxine 5'-phosphate oxidase superfamily flavin-nucleotide-binding protein